MSVVEHDTFLNPTRVPTEPSLRPFYVLLPPGTMVTWEEVKAETNATYVPEVVSLGDVAIYATMERVWIDVDGLSMIVSFTLHRGNVEHTMMHCRSGRLVRICNADTLGIVSKFNKITSKTYDVSCQFTMKIV